MNPLIYILVIVISVITTRVYMHYRPSARSVGVMRVIEKDSGGLLFSFELDKEAKALSHQETVIFRVIHEPSANSQGEQGL